MEHTRKSMKVVPLIKTFQVKERLSETHQWEEPS